MSKPRVAWIMGSDSDLTCLERAIELMRGEFGIPCEVRVLSAHRTPRELSAYLDGCAARGIQIIVAAAGWSAALPGVAAAATTIPVIGVPISSSVLAGRDAILSMVMMPGGIPVATMSPDEAGAKNATLFAASVLALSDPSLANKLTQYRASMAKAVLEKDRTVQERYG